MDDYNLTYTHKVTGQAVKLKKLDCYWYKLLVDPTTNESIRINQTDLRASYKSDKGNRGRAWRRK